MSTSAAFETSNASLLWDTLRTTAPPTQNQTQKSIKELVYNGTGYFIEDEADQEIFAVAGLDDLQTLFLSCLATLLPLIATLLTAFCLRLLYYRYKGRVKRDLDQESPDAAESLTRPLHSHLLNTTDKKSAETHLSINTEEVEICEPNQIRNNHSSTNGSIITMTLKNNHLIVETEERNDLEEDSRETTMKYSPGANDGVFVVEVQQGSRRSPGGIPESSESSQHALVHHPPDRFSDTLEEGDFYVETTSLSTTPDLLSQVRTGLAQSDQSLGHPSYCYTNQQCYDTGSYGYSQYSGYVTDDVTSSVPPHPAGHQQEEARASSKPKITAALYKNAEQPEAIGAEET